MTLTRISRILGGRQVLGKDIETKMDLFELGRKGIAKSAVLHLADFISLPLNQMEKILPITNRTLQRYSKNQHLAPPVTEQLIQVAEVIARGEEVFEDKDKFMEWMKRPSTALSGKTPLGLLGSRFGIEMILDELGRIETGVYS